MKIHLTCPQCQNNITLNILEEDKLRLENKGLKAQVAAMKVLVDSRRDFRGAYSNLFDRLFGGLNGWT